MFLMRESKAPPLEVLSCKKLTQIWGRDKHVHARGAKLEKLRFCA